MALPQAPLDLAELEPNDPFHGFVADREVGDDHGAAEERRLEDLVELGLERLHEALGFGHGLGIGAELHQGVGAGVGRQHQDRVLEVDLATLAVLHHALVEDLIEELENVGVRLLHLV